MEQNRDLDLGLTLELHGQPNHPTKKVLQNDLFTCPTGGLQHQGRGQVNS